MEFALAHRAVDIPIRAAIDSGESSRLRIRWQDFAMLTGPNLVCGDIHFAGTDACVDEAVLTGHNRASKRFGGIQSHQIFKASRCRIIADEFAVGIRSSVEPIVRTKCHIPYELLC